MIHRSRLPPPIIPDLDLPGFVLEHAGERGSRPALRDGATGETITYAELPGLVQGAAAVLVGAGVHAGDVVALISPNQPWWAVTYYAVLRAGASVVPVNPASTDDEIAHILLASGARTVVADAGVEGRVRRVADALGVTVLSIGGAPSCDLRDRVRIRLGPKDCGPAAVSGTRRGREAVVPGRRRPGDLAALPYSSGTTGLPKGVMLTHRNLVATIVQHAGLYHVGTDDVVLAALPMFHIYGMSIITNYSLRHGATVVTMPRFSLDRFVALIGTEKVTWLHLAPPVILLLAGLEPGRPDLASVRHAISGAAPLDARVQQRAEAVLGCAIGQGYGMTEASPGVTFVPDDGRPGSWRGSVGLLVAGTEARIVDPETEHDIGDASGTGEMWVRGPQVMAGYLANPDATAETIVEGGWLRTGDIVRVDAAGVWWVVDRLKELIKYNGYQVAPAELEALLLSHPGIDDAAVVGLPDPAAGELPVGFVVAAARGAPDPEEILAWVAERVTPYKKLRRVVLVDRIPKSASGKLLRRQLRRTALEGGSSL